MLESVLDSIWKQNKTGKSSSLQAQKNAAPHIRETELLRLIKNKFNAIKDLSENHGLLSLFSLGFLIKRSAAQIANIKINPSQSSSYFPAISSLGIHLVPIKKGLCSFVDLYEDRACENKTSDIFCKDHQNEFNLSYSGDESTLSRFSVMHRFYSNLDNLNEYDEERLEQLLSEFFASYGKKGLTKPKNLEDCLALFEIKDSSHLLEVGEKGIKKKYLNLAKKMHPDFGGCVKDFQKLSSSYEVLLAEFSNHHF